MTGQHQQRSALAVGVEWASKVSTIAMGFSVPPLIGFGVDRWCGSTPVATLVGVLLGFVSGLFQTLRLAKDLPGVKSPKGSHPHPAKGDRPRSESSADESPSSIQAP